MIMSQAMASSKPAPIATPSMRATMICTRTYSWSDSQAAFAAPSTAARAFRGATRTHQRQMPVVKRTHGRHKANDAALQSAAAFLPFTDGVRDVHQE